MSKLKKIAVLLLIVAMFSTFLPNDLFVEANNEKTVSKSFSNVKSGQILEVEFEHHVERENIELEGLKLDKIEGKEGKYVYIFTVEKDMNEVTINLYYNSEVTHILQTHEEGEGSNHGEAGKGEGGNINWEDFKLGKHSWENQGGYDRQYAIRIDAKKYQDYEYIYVIDEYQNLKGPEKLRVSKLEIGDDNKVENTGSANFKIVNKPEENRFIVRIQVDKLNDGEELRYDIIYFMNKTPESGEPKNKYRVVTNKKEIYEESKGDGSGISVDDGDNNEDIDNEEEVEDEEIEDNEKDSEPTPPITPEPPALIDIKVTKQWEMEPLDEIEVVLFRNNEQIETVTLNDKNNWVHIFKELYEYDHLGNKYLYEIREVTDSCDCITVYEYTDARDEWVIINKPKIDVEEEDSKEEENEDIKEDIDDEPVIEEVEDDEEDIIEDDQTKEEIEKDEDTTEGTIDKIEKQDEQGEDVEEVDNVVGDSLPKTGEKKGYILFGVVVLLLGLLNIKTRG